MNNDKPVFSLPPYKIKIEPIQDEIESSQLPTAPEFINIKCEPIVETPEPQFCLLETSNNVQNIEPARKIRNSKSKSMISSKNKRTISRNLNVTDKNKPKQDVNITKPKAKRIRKKKFPSRQHEKKLPEPIIIEQPIPRAASKYICNVCGKSLSTRNILNRHKRTVHINAPVICKICNKEFKTKTYLRVHKYKIHSNNKFFCEHCNYSSINKVNIMYHMKGNHLRIQRYRPAKKITLNEQNVLRNDTDNNLCSQESFKELEFPESIESPLESPIKSEPLENVEVSDDSEFYKISEPSIIAKQPIKSEPSKILVSSPSKTTELSKISTSSVISTTEKKPGFLNTNKSVTTCDICNLTFKNVSKLEYHKKSVHSHITDNKNTPLFSCNICHELFETLDKNHIHKRRKHGIKSPCTLCNKVFNSNYDLSMHNRRIHNKYYCAHCKYTARTKGYLVQHIKRTHLTKKTLFYCQKCKSKFYTFEKLTDHYIQNHNDNIVDVYKYMRDNLQLKNN